MPFSSAKAALENGASTDIPRTEASAASRPVIASVKVHISLVQTPVKAAG
ncbi:uncharacterized protein METZ01_LOCUS44880 [marine metagenome]|uniref:Uncharacterized protein n=1 Tax=marine metagenome TaxID=408172 RepID=A0A381RJL4_9ZZZZ